MYMHLEVPFGAAIRYRRAHKARWIWQLIPDIYKFNLVHYMCRALNDHMESRQWIERQNLPGWRDWCARVFERLVRQEELYAIQNLLQWQLIMDLVQPGLLNACFV